MEVLSNSFWILSLIKEQDAPMSSVWEDVIKMFSCETSRLLHPTVSCLYWPRLWALKSRILRMRLKNNSFMEWVFLAEQLNPQIKVLTKDNPATVGWRQGEPWTEKPQAQKQANSTKVPTGFEPAPSLEVRVPTTGSPLVEGLSYKNWSCCGCKGWGNLIFNTTCSDHLIIGQESKF